MYSVQNSKQEYTELIFVVGCVRDRFRELKNTFFFKIKNKKKVDAARKSHAGGDDKLTFFFTGPDT